jgi:hypothetical protein
MAAISVRNSSSGLLTMWLEPLGEDRWLKPGETFQTRSDFTGDEQPFSLDLWVDDGDHAVGIENITVWVDQGDCRTVVTTDTDGNTIECGHQRPHDVDQRWRAMSDEARKRTSDETSG